MWLALDTSLDACTLALVQDDVIVGQAQEILGKGHAELLPQLLEALLQQTSYPSVDSIAVCVGPGSFTGLRVGLAAAKALALAWNVPVLGASSLEAVAHLARSEHAGPLLVAHDAKRGQVFTQCFGAVPGSDVEVLSPEAAAALALEAGCAIAGSGTALLLQQAPRLRALACPAYPQPRSLIACAHLSTDPIYVRPPDALTLAERGL